MEALAPLQTSTRESRKVAAGTLVILLIVGTAAIFRFIARHDEFWLDEVWSYEIARTMTSVADVFRERIDNNHPLNTLWIYLLGESAPLPLYRLPALLSGLTTVALAYVILRRRDEACGLIGAGLLACSYPMVVYASEARGYAPMLMATLIGLNTVDRAARGSRRLISLELTAATLIGMVSHGTFVFAYAGMFAYSLVNAIPIARFAYACSWHRRRITHLLRHKGFPAQQDATARRSCDEHAPASPVAATNRFGSVLRLHAGPIFLIGLIWYGFYRNMGIGGGASESLGTILKEATQWATGIPHFPIAILLFGTICLLAIRYVRDGLLVFNLVAGIVAPGGLLALQYLSGDWPEVLFTRYFLLSVLCFNLTIALTLGRLCRLRSLTDQHRKTAVMGLRAYWPTALTVTLLLASMAGNLIQIVPFLTHGRSHYAEALTDILARSGDGPITVGGDHNFRSRMMIDFYSPRMLKSGPVTFHSIDATPPQWLILAGKPRADVVRQETDYRRIRTYFDAASPAGSLSIYRQVRN